MVAPAGISVYSIHVVNAQSNGIGVGNYYGAHGWWGEFYWNGGPGPAGRSGPLNDAQFNSGGCCSQTNLQSRTIGWFIACNQSSCPTGSSGIGWTVGELDLTAEEDQAPDITATGTDNLWYHSGWVRGTWSASFTATDPSGVCGAAVVFGSLPAILTPTPDTSPDRHTWQQCPQQTVPAVIDTTASLGSLGQGNGAMQLRLTATNTADVTANPTKTVYVDNTTPALALSGPTDVPSTAGTQYVDANAGGSPSGIADILCSVDGSSPTRYPGASARVPVSGVGTHSITCRAEDNAVDPGGNHGLSAPVTRSLRIGAPTTLGIAFTRFVNGLRCHRTRSRIHVPPRWITMRRHGQRIRLRAPGFTRTVTLTRCHPRTARRRVVTWRVERIHGHLQPVPRVRYVRVVLPPHAVRASALRVPFGHAATIRGWLGRATDGTALAGRTVRILTAPADGRNLFTQTATAVTSRNGSWSVRLAAGPSRLIQAIYDGDAGTEPTASTPAYLEVPAAIVIHVTPTVVRWGGHILIRGRLLGGHIPPGSNVLKLLFGDGPRPHTIGTPQVRPDGRFRIPISWSTGRGVINYWFAVATLKEADYPYAPGTSRRVVVTVR